MDIDERGVAFGRVTLYVDAVRSYPAPGCASPSSATCSPTPATSCTRCADRLGIPRRFFQDHPWRWHHDLPAHLRPRALELGAREVTMHEVGALLRAAEERDIAAIA